MCPENCGIDLWDWRLLVAALGLLLGILFGLLALAGVISGIKNMIKTFRENKVSFFHKEPKPEGEVSDFNFVNFAAAVGLVTVIAAFLALLTFLVLGA